MTPRAMVPALVLLLLTAAGTALGQSHLDNGRMAHEAKSAHRSFSSRISAVANDTVEPCAALSQAFEAAASTNAKKGKGLVVLDVRPSVATACLKSVPLTKDRAAALVDYLTPYMEWHSTTEILKNPPEGYLVPGVDIFGGMQAIKQKLQGDGYKSQYEVMTDLQNIIIAANDNHLIYTPGMLGAFRLMRPDFDFMSISEDGRKTPEIFFARDIYTQSNGTRASSSPIASIDGQDIHEFLENESLKYPQNFQDPDAQLNVFFSSTPLNAVGVSSMAITSVLEIPDSYNITYKNGTSRQVTNAVVVPAAVSLAGIRSGVDFQKKFEIPMNRGNKPGPPPKKPQPKPPAPKPTVKGYPFPVAKHPNDLIAGYMLNQTGFQDTAVISFLGFSPIDGSGDDDSEEQFAAQVRQAGDVITQTAKVAKQQGRDKVIIDMSANGGGLLNLADFTYTTLFPGARFDAFDRYRHSTGLDFFTRVAPYRDSAQFLVAPLGFPQGPDNRPIEDPNAFFSPQEVKGQNMTAAFISDKTAPLTMNRELFLPGYGPSDANRPMKPLWEPQNMVILTDGLCASACSIFVGLLVRNFGIRTIALGGRAMNQPMQAIGGVRGSQVLSNSEIQGVVGQALEESRRQRRGRYQRAPDQNEKTLGLGDPPLLPFLDGPAGGSINARNAYSQNDTTGFPLHFQYQAANCRLFFTREMVLDVTEAWRQAASVAFKNGTCVPGSTVNEDGTMGATTPGFNPSVKSRGKGVPVPSLSP
ncbi:hypothetical protein JDV02_008264 [Purpureocillium takamizusanense]|uniref:CPAF-like PDZ domain-containing protein n=1 Tax=Purpureocillium takamizusanense TaxID=2060973 RepID=A0A9Q8VE75_9HYPO|nr:uncharacterized protein JDV02_008264 [Purpureocillium takamizusanense]UNI22368.1 hypothetical protein JDV02_008264 [Purpureocillium takamizusanense]